ncbi:uncharacterized protein BBOV_IV000340 [Babesia bovis T2Bo]|uniref:Membrane protein, putative n=1 Tax=Babesia bovis TaxID=5865 RepID=A7AV08_BABBO|nr:uncharacterized protein BBOV_IV000340 [Babesia bovis T2Bo]EDO05634.1 putative integral membrane protein [Babesia bovis T2Bo]|eukprot:XP_001609202.1 hypothetical protein [Babesia bovis T2Bo]
MDTSTCTTIVLVLLWLYLCCQELGSLITVVGQYSSTKVLYSTTTLSTLLLAVCLWQCKKAGYLVSPMTWYHWVLLVLLVLLQIAVILMAVPEQLDQDGGNRPSYGAKWKYPIYGVSAALLVILGCTLFCGWKCNLFCRPCCKSQYVCYGSAIVVALVVLLILAVTLSMIQYQDESNSIHGDHLHKGETEKTIIGHLDKVVVPCAQCYAMAIIWRTMLNLPYTVPEVVTLISSTLAVASILALAALGTAVEYHSTLSSTRGYIFLALHLVALGITLYCLEYKAVFHWPKEYMCFGLLAVVLLITLVAVTVVMLGGNAIFYGVNGDVEAMKYTLLGYSFLLMVPTLWYAYRCGLFKWCLPKKKGLKGTETAENTVPDTDIA